MTVNQYLGLTFGLAEIGMCWYGVLCGQRAERIWSWVILSENFYMIGSMGVALVLVQFPALVGHHSANEIAFMLNCTAVDMVIWVISSYVILKIALKSRKTWTVVVAGLQLMGISAEVAGTICNFTGPTLIWMETLPVFVGMIFVSVSVYTHKGEPKSLMDVL